MLKEKELIAFGNELRKMRKEDMKLSLKQLGDQLDIDWRTLSAYERGEHEMGAMLYRRFVKLHDEMMLEKHTSLLQQISKMPPKKQEAIMKMIELMAGSDTHY